MLLKILIKNDVNLVNECAFWKNDINRLGLECKNLLLEQNEDYLEYIKSKEESNLGRSLIR